MRHVILLLAALSACGPHIEVFDTARGDALVQSTRMGATPLREPCPEGFETLFPDEDYYSLPPGQDVARLRVVAADPNGVRHLSILIPVFAGRPDDRPDLEPEPVTIPEEPVPVFAYILDDAAATTGGPDRADLAFDFRPGSSSAAYFVVVAQDDPRIFRATRRELVSVRGFRSVCAPLSG